MGETAFERVVEGSTTYPAQRRESRSIVLLGAGRLAANLAPALVQSGFNLLQVWSRTEASAYALAEPLGVSYTTDLEAIKTEADVYIACVADAALPEIASRIVNRIGTVPLFLHTAGSVGLDLWKHCRAKRYGILYPLQTFSKERVVDMRKVSFFVESSEEETLKEIESLAHRLSGKVFRADSKRRARLHIAAVFACNFVNAMYDVAHHLLTEDGIPFEVLLPLIDETSSKVHTLTPREAQTGPAVRGDQTVMQRHLEALVEDKCLQQLYVEVSRMIQRNAFETSGNSDGGVFSGISHNL